MYRYSGAGNTFAVLDGRTGDVSRYRLPETVQSVCAAEGTDGLMILSLSDRADFRMEFFNPDGSTGMMCGNGGRCIVAFARYLGISPSSGDGYVFEASDGLHDAWITDGDGLRCTVRLRMAEAKGLREVGGGWFIDTGTRHFVQFVDDVEAVDVERTGRSIRWSEDFAPEGVNVNFVRRMPDGSIQVRTFEKGVERETLACGTGAVASAVVANQSNRETFTTTVHARISDLAVEHNAEGTFLVGPAENLGPCGQ